MLIIILVSAVDKSDVKKENFISISNIVVEYTDSNSNIPLIIKSSHIWFQTLMNLSTKFYQDQNKEWFNFYNFPEISKKPNKIMIVGGSEMM